MPTPIGAGTVPWPDDLAAAYVDEGYWLGKSLGGLLHAVADRRPDEVALVDGGTGTATPTCSPGPTARQPDWPDSAWSAGTGS